MRNISMLTLALVLSACGGSSTDSDSNTAPIANAGSDQSVSIGSIVNLDASGSSDADNDSLSYSWLVTDTPASSSVALDAYDAESASFTPDVGGSYTFEASVSDGSETVSDQVVITATTTTAASPDASSTAGILCDYSYSEFNDDVSVNMISTSDWTCSETTRDIVANGIPDHVVGEFPNEANPNTIAEVDVAASYTLTPEESDTATQKGGPLGPQGFVLNGIKIDAGTGGSCSDNADGDDADCDAGINTLGWSLEALGYEDFEFFGADQSNAHVQPDGQYHYHGMPEEYITKVGGNSSEMTLIAWAADGFPIYARYGYSDPEDSSSSIVAMTGSYEHIDTVSDSRPSTDVYVMGMFSQDWQYAEGSGDLDECNGRFAVTPEFPEGIYHYYATDSYPYFQRCVKGVIGGETDGAGDAGGPTEGGGGTGGPREGGGAGGPPSA